MFYYDRVHFYQSHKESSEFKIPGTLPLKLVYCFLLNKLIAWVQKLDV